MGRSKERSMPPPPPWRRVTSQCLDSILQLPTISTRIILYRNDIQKRLMNDPTRPFRTAKGLGWSQVFDRPFDPFQDRNVTGNMFAWTFLGWSESIRAKLYHPRKKSPEHLCHSRGIAYKKAPENHGLEHPRPGARWLFPNWFRSKPRTRGFGGVRGR